MGRDRLNTKLVIGEGPKEEISPRSPMAPSKRQVSHSNSDGAVPPPMSIRPNCPTVSPATLSQHLYPASDASARLCNKHSRLSKSWHTLWDMGHTLRRELPCKPSTKLPSFSLSHIRHSLLSPEIPFISLDPIPELQFFFSRIPHNRNCVRIAIL